MLARNVTNSCEYLQATDVREHSLSHIKAETFRVRVGIPIILTLSAMKNIVAKASVEETFPKQIAIYDLNEFLSSTSLFKQPVIDFEDNNLLIKEENSKGQKLKYFYSDPSVITTRCGGGI